MLRRLVARGLYSFPKSGYVHLILNFWEVANNKATTLESLAESMAYARGRIDTDNNQNSPYIRDQLRLFQALQGVEGSLKPFMQAGTLFISTIDGTAV